MDWELTEEDYRNFEVAREGYEDGFGASGYVAVVKGSDAAIVRVDRNSWCGTWGNGNPVEWTGTRSELLHLARTKTDIDLSGREIRADDYMGKHLLALYESVLQWASTQ